VAGIRVCQVTKTLDRVLTLSNISLSLDCHEFAVILGPSGCGKSTLLNIIAGLIVPDQGRIEIGGIDWTGRTGRASYMQQKDLLLPSRDILNNVCIPLILKGTDKQEAYATARLYLKDFGLDGFEKYYPRQLSGGMRQRAALLRTYLFTSDIMLMDEPFAGLDAITCRKMQLWFKKICTNYKPTVLFVTHDIDEALLLADSIYVFSPRPAQVKLHIQAPSASNVPKEEIKQQILSFLETD
jgi:ABC-type nitrate/sulfonate/bicarbonate transport system ATPase subunit